MSVEMRFHPLSDSSGRLVFTLGSDRYVEVQVSIASSTPVVHGVPPRPKAGDSLVATLVDAERMLLVSYGLRELERTSTPVVQDVRPQN